MGGGGRGRTDLTRLCSLLDLLLKVQRDIAQLLLDVPHDFSLGRRGERVPSFLEELDQVVGQVPPGEIESGDGVREGEAVVDRDDVRDSIAGIEDDAGGSARGVEGEDGLRRRESKRDGVSDERLTGWKNRRGGGNGGPTWIET